MTKAKNIFTSPDATVLLWLGLWWAVNILTAAFSELANDEAYYHMFAQRLAWGYFDHPPVTALLVWLGEHLFGGELGVRFFFTLLQPCYLWLFWRIIRPADADCRDARLYSMICAAMLVLQLYGFIAVPDGPLLWSSVIFLAAFKAFADERRWSWLWLGLSIGLMAYCKYQGALVLIFTLLANVKWFFERPRRIVRLFAGGVVALLCIVPHLVWQYRHDWASFAYHLSGRNGSFSISNITDFLVNMAVVFSPFYLPLWVQAYRKVQAETPVERALKLFPPAFIIFFTASAVRGYVQPQWAIAAVFGLVWILFAYARRHSRTRRFVMGAGLATLILIALVRIEMIFNPIGLRFEVFDNRTSYGQIAEAAAGRPVVFDSSYATAAKYMFYADTDLTFSQPNVEHRTSEWQFRDNDRRFAGRDVLVQVNPSKHAGEEVSTLHLPNGRDFSYKIIEDFKPMREVSATLQDELAVSAHRGDSLHFALELHNPYGYDIHVDGRTLRLDMLWCRRREPCRSVSLTDSLTLPAGGTVVVGCRTAVPDDLEAADYTVGFAVRHKDMYTWFGGKPVQMVISNE